ncbi:MAG: metallophosphoesterase [Nitriliruptoraceae bacterium]
MVRFLHTSDWQLGMTRHFLIGSDAQERFTQDRIDAVGTLASVARDRGCAFVVVAGDVFETNQPQRRTLERALDALGTFDVPVYLLPGNHDHQGAASVYRSDAFTRRCPASVHVLADGPLAPVPGVEVVGAPWHGRRPLEDLVTRRCRELAADGTTRVVVGHGQVDTVVGDHDNPATIRLAALERAVADAGVSYVALGDRHSALQVGDTGRIWYSGAPEATDHRDGGPGTALVVDLPDGLLDDVPTVEVVQVGRWTFHRVERSLDSDGDVDALLADLDGIDDRARAVVRVVVEGTVSLAQAAALDDGLALRAERFGALELPDRHRDLTIRPTAEDVAALPLGGYAAVARDRLLERAIRGDGVEAAEASDALALLTRLTDRDGA